jgi:hypothetical protein
VPAEEAHRSSLSGRSAEPIEVTMFAGRSAAR